MEQPSFHGTDWTGLDRSSRLFSHPGHLSRIDMLITFVSIAILLSSVQRTVHSSASTPSTNEGVALQRQLNSPFDRLPVNRDGHAYWARALGVDLQKQHFLGSQLSRTSLVIVYIGSGIQDADRIFIADSNGHSTELDAPFGWKNPKDSHLSACLSNHSGYSEVKVIVSSNSSRHHSTLDNPRSSQLGCMGILLGLLELLLFSCSWMQYDSVELHLDLTNDSELPSSLSSRHHHNHNHNHGHSHQRSSNHRWNGLKRAVDGLLAAYRMAQQPMARVHSIYLFDLGSHAEANSILDLFSQSQVQRLSIFAQLNEEYLVSVKKALAVLPQLESLHLDCDGQVFDPQTFTPFMRILWNIAPSAELNPGEEEAEEEAEREETGSQASSSCSSASTTMQGQDSLPLLRRLDFSGGYVDELHHYQHSLIFQQNWLFELTEVLAELNDRPEDGIARTVFSQIQHISLPSVSLACSCCTKHRHASTDASATVECTNNSACKTCRNKFAILLKWFPSLQSIQVDASIAVASNETESLQEFLQQQPIHGHFSSSVSPDNKLRVYLDGLQCLSRWAQSKGIVIDLLLAYPRAQQQARMHSFPLSHQPSIIMTPSFSAEHARQKAFSIEHSRLKLLLQAIGPRARALTLDVMECNVLLDESFADFILTLLSSSSSSTEHERQAMMMLLLRKKPQQTHHAINSHLQGDEKDEWHHAMNSHLQQDEEIQLHHAVNGPQQQQQQHYELSKVTIIVASPITIPLKQQPCVPSSNPGSIDSTPSMPCTDEHAPLHISSSSFWLKFKSKWNSDCKHPMVQSNSDGHKSIELHLALLYSYSVVPLDSIRHCHGHHPDGSLNDSDDYSSGQDEHAAVAIPATVLPPCIRIKAGKAASTDNASN